MNDSAEISPFREDVEEYWEDLCGVEIDVAKFINAQTFEDITKDAQEIAGSPAWGDNKTFDTSWPVQTSTCIYCGEEIPLLMPPHTIDFLTSHIKICPKHPLRVAETKINILKTALESLVYDASYALKVIAAHEVSFTNNIS